MAKKLKHEKLFVNLKRGGELRYEIAYNARDAARVATKWSRKGWDASVTSGAKTRAATFMECRPSAKKAYWSDPDVKAHAICTMTPAFKKRVRGR